MSTRIDALLHPSSVLSVSEVGLSVLAHGPTDSRSTRIPSSDSRNGS